VAQLMTLEHARILPVAQRAHMLRRAEREAHPETKFHLHFGGGRLGLGLLSPALAKVGSRLTLTLHVRACRACVIAAIAPACIERLSAAHVFMHDDLHVHARR
jgi:hypothetical protein